MRDAPRGRPLFGHLSIGHEPSGATLIADEDLEGLIPEFIATRADLNLVEYENIAKAIPWATRQAGLVGPLGVLDYRFLFTLHRKMFGDVWRWAGTVRRRESNISVYPSQIPDQLKQALDDAVYWHENETFTLDERAARLHFRLVTVHPFPNGNGRATRLISDLYLAAAGSTPFTWGSGRQEVAGKIREAYIRSLVSARTDDCASLVAFARS
ncbi:MAG: mobile mystery protein B [Chloroflexi bacterium]|nr:mobile mystery protein B [Chloroflexota bacterium]